MTINFDGSDIHGAHGQPVTGSFGSESQRRFYFGLHGQTEKRGGRSGRPISIEIWVFNNFGTYEAIRDYIEDNIMEKINSHGDLRIDGDPFDGYTFKDCTLDAFEMDTRTPLQDIAGTVDKDNGVNKWFAIGTLIFWQLNTGEGNGNP